MTINDAAHKWVGEFTRIPYGILEKLLAAGEEITELTPISRGDSVYVWNGQFQGEYGEVRSVRSDGKVLVEFYNDDKQYRVLDPEDMEASRDGTLPMWGTLWAFNDSCDDWWLEKPENLQKMADCGFRIYEQEDYGYIFGIDGAGYDFYEAHWIPLYKARGLHWHDREVAA